ncbi:hypothetical protein CAEBREN_11872 [Caenorhabditis brenneri]|uniref:G-protein coupled receptors family 1 profile domain-containing protein n=1 Tax=Caenorhabditis brenneri TaxID=135651 RepID=G0MUA2_CAEBE|nr:hypothetical protein CAEBREN_11872 [Caenorhabditis brenneri]
MKAHHLQKTPTTTTENPLYYDEYYTNSVPWDYYFGDYGSFKVDHQTLIPLVLKLEKIHNISVVICFFIQYFHFLVLSRKPLRHDFVYLTLLGISFFNLFFNIAELIPVVLESKIVYKIEEDCVGGRPFFHQRIVIWCHVISRITKKYSWILGIFLTGFRIFSLARPMSQKVRVVRRTSLKVFMMCCVPCILWYLPYLLKFKIERSIGCDFKFTPTSYRRFNIDIDPKFERFYESTDGYMSVIFGVMFWVLAMILSLQLKRNGTNIEKIVSKHKRDRHPILQ